MLITLSQIREFGSNILKRFYRYVNYRGQPIYLETVKFHSSGVTKSTFDNLQISIPKQALVEILKLDDYVRDHFSLPTLAPADWAILPTPYKSLSDTLYDRLYLQIGDNLRVFNFDHEELTYHDFRPGEYKAIIKVKGIYYGHRGNLDKIASLQMQVIQIRYKPELDEDCLFLPE